MKTALAFQHVGFEDLDAFSAPLERYGYAITYVDAFGADTKLANESDLLIVLGGPIGVCDDKHYPFLRSELALIEQRLVAARPMIGICLGAQLIAHAAGARVYPSGHKEIGFAPISLTPEGEQSCLRPFSLDPMTLHWHGDTFDLPRGAVRLASTPRCENQAFAIGEAVIGFQFHPEVSGRRIEHWLVGHAVELAQAGIDIPQIRRDAVGLAEGLEHKAAQVVEHWVSGLPE